MKFVREFIKPLTPKPYFSMLMQQSYDCLEAPEFNYNDIYRWIGDKPLVTNLCSSPLRSNVH